MKKAVITAGAATALVVLAAGYFIAVPLIQISNYQKAVAAKHQQVNDKLVKVYDSFKRDAFTKADTKAAADKIDIKVGQEALRDARSALDTNAKDLTGFKALPLLGWNADYREATQLDASEEQYIKDARTFLASYDSLLAYSEKSADLKTKSEQAATSLENISGNDDPQQIATKVDASAAELQAVIDQAKGLTPPAYLKADQDQTITLGNRMVAAFKLLGSGARELNLAKIYEAQAEINRVSAESDRQTEVTLTILHRDSDIQKQIDKLRNLNDQINGHYAKI